MAYPQVDNGFDQYITPRKQAPDEDEIDIPAYMTGCSTLTGAKPFEPNWVNQDNYLEMGLGGGYIFLGVFDGHGPNGTYMSGLVKNAFAERAHEISRSADITQAFMSAFSKISDECAEDGLSYDSGSTATVALIDTYQNRVSIAHCGDSTALLVDEAGGVIFLSRDHKPSDPIEAERLRAQGSAIVDGRLMLRGRTDSHIGFTRSFGDLGYVPQGVNAEPEIVDGLHFEPGSALILGSDGVWDMVTKEDVTHTICTNSPQSAAESITKTAHSAWTRATHIDDITALVVKKTNGFRSPVSKRNLFGGGSGSTYPPDSPRVSEDSSESGTRTPPVCGGPLGLAGIIDTMRFFQKR
jgi:serine/threonine protein phosphatase PrpC